MLHPPSLKDPSPLVYHAVDAVALVVISADVGRLVEALFALFAGLGLHRLPLYSLTKMPLHIPLPTTDGVFIGFSCLLTPFYKSKTRQDRGTAQPPLRGKRQPVGPSVGFSQPSKLVKDSRMEKMAKSCLDLLTDSFHRRLWPVIVQDVVRVLFWISRWLGVNCRFLSYDHLGFLQRFLCRADLRISCTE